MRVGRLAPEVQTPSSCKHRKGPKHFSTDVCQVLALDTHPSGEMLAVIHVDVKHDPMNHMNPTKCKECNLQDALLRLYNDVLYTGEPPASWSKTLFTMLPKKLRAKQVTDFRPIANLRLLYKVFAYLLLGRLEHVLDAQQPEEQHGFRAGRRLEEHLLSANILLDKAQATGFPVWIISLDLSKAFDRVHWPALWAALLEQGVSEHLIWILQRVYYGQHGEIVGNFGQSDQFPITGGVRQGWVLSPRLFCAVLEFAMRKWRHAAGQAGIDLMDGGPNLLDLRFADDIIICARSRHELGQLVDSLTIHLEQVGLLLNADKNCGANQWGAAASNSCNGWRTETCDLATECWSKVVGLYVGSRRITITTHRSGISSAASIKVFLRKPLDFIGPKRFHFQTLEIFQCRGLISRMLW